MDFSRGRFARAIKMLTIEPFTGDLLAHLLRDADSMKLARDTSINFPWIYHPADPFERTFSLLDENSGYRTKLRRVIHDRGWETCRIEKNS